MARKYAFARLGIYPETGGDPIVLDHGNAWHDNLTGDRTGGTSELGGIGTAQQGYELCKHIPGLGLTHRFFRVAQNTRLSQFTFSGTGSWDERRPAFGERKYYIRQYDVSPGVTFAAESVPSVPENPNFILNIRIAESPFNWDFSAMKPYHRVEFGGYGIHFEEGAIFLVRWVGGQWQIIGDIQNASPRSNNGLDITLWVECHAGKIYISTDFGREFTEYGNPNPLEPITVSAGTLILRGQGGAVELRIDQLKPYAAVYTSEQANTFTPRVAPTATISGRTTEPGNTEIVWEDNSDPSSGLIGYKATLTPDEVMSGWGWNFWQSPVLHYTNFFYPVSNFVFLETADEDYNASIIEVSVEKPREIHAGTATIHLQRNPRTESLLNNPVYDRRKIYIVLGHTLTVGAPEEWVAFTGYIRTINEGWTSWGVRTIEIVADNVSCKLKDTTWTIFDVVPLSDIGTVNEINDYILSSEGMGGTLGTSLPNYRTWHAAGNTGLDNGLATEPFELIVPDEPKWETLERINKYKKLEVAITDDGKYETVPMDPDYTTGNIHHWRTTPEVGGTDIRELIKALSAATDCAETCSLVLVVGTGYNGSSICGYAVDSIGESPTLGPAFGRFKPWRTTLYEVIQNPTTVDILTQRAQGIAWRKFRNGAEPRAVVPVNLQVGRFDEVRIYGANSPNVPDGVRLKVNSLRHHYVKRTALSELETQVSFKRLSYAPIPE